MRSPLLSLCSAPSCSLCWSQRSMAVKAQQDSAVCLDQGLQPLSAHWISTEVALQHLHSYMLLLCTTIVIGRSTFETSLQSAMNHGELTVGFREQPVANNCKLIQTVSHTQFITLLRFLHNYRFANQCSSNISLCPSELFVWSKLLQGTKEALLRSRPSGTRVLCAL